MHILNLVSSILPINSGILNASTATASVLKQKSTELFWYSNESKNESITSWHRYSRKHIRNNLMENSLIISHGLWLWPTKEGHYWKNKGVRWVAYPHGMLDPWAMKHKGFKKKLYWRFFEQKMLHRADAIVALSQSEYKSLSMVFSNVCLIPNGIQAYDQAINKEHEKRKFLFLGRLHKKKGVLPLVQAWHQSALNNHAKFDLIIVGPDEGELSGMLPLVQKSSNISYVGSKYGNEKESILSSSHFFILPSQSEGFPMSVLEAMTHGGIPILSDGCNFPEAFENEVAIRTTVNPNDIVQALEYAATLSNEQIGLLSERAKQFVDENYNIEKIAQMQHDLYLKVLNET
jgi:glycosyltransferase involved in cell wall biosynthesis